MEVLNIGFMISAIIITTNSNDDRISEDEILDVFAVDVRRVHRSLVTSHYSSMNQGFYHSSDDVRGGYNSQEISLSSSLNCGLYNFGDNGRGRSRSQDTRQYYSCNSVSRVNVDLRCGYRSHTSHY